MEFLHSLLIDSIEREIEHAAATSILDCLAGREPVGAVNRPPTPRGSRRS